MCISVSQGRWAVTGLSLPVQFSALTSSSQLLMLAHLRPHPVLLVKYSWGWRTLVPSPHALFVQSVTLPPAAEEGGRPTSCVICSAGPMNTDVLGEVC